jgi:outer membrane protein assembly factor BamE (lipoprotein component of BamABCDE complex)
MLRWPAAFLVLLSLVGCAHGSPESAATRSSRYLSAHPGTSSDIAEAIRQRKVILGMDKDQVVAAVGQPDIRSRFGGARWPEVWLYRASRLYQDILRSHGASFFRIAFADDRVSAVEPL